MMAGMQRDTRMPGNGATSSAAPVIVLMIKTADPGDKQLSSLPSFFIKQHEESRRGLRHSSTLITWKLASGPAPAVLHGRLSQRALVKGFPAPEPQKLFFRALPVF
ncbi:hypothetical protein CXU14_06535 [Akkermansia muciniphila]|uniref:Uncharacterized protein n=1 Tax=Akkermansia massiliensis TaxID=2927224 RepID=A0AAE6VZR3_9BACT|nr:hypothetical protein CXU18_02360 [Akkermansia muciniphila]QHV61901.1 hypothetical protein DMI76_00250 [Akkermansia massiliensis]PNC27647.1 hypothetical protein CXU16_01440 [Akkermansia muciniphila]PNC44656.1 hypothetical protein CXU14_06535 [Akkermansia muciniphila]PNC52043.1 hypothetical protein CXU15_02975 [Akkermansia muciniphila]